MDKAKRTAIAESPLLMSLDYTVAIRSPCSVKIACFVACKIVFFNRMIVEVELCI